ncbi:MAG: Site-determining protein [Thermotoga sp. 50_1627]|uniref:MinD/ParA family protein n=1 Tax=Pseudothermotoga sp. TaxID=2033661 RepID=UPI00076C2007|nr:MAG: Site-determining protein [Thermotoga sp. 50_64]KUK25415.1 MAG: Site-determining protein [Thermotoga sp. 50_1627]MBC7116764.1 MinD/ParA family protein [Pseudothermotoga sp.]MDK2923375.1 flagellar biosynthesis protein FlhG [Pseudothermotoga sp.]HBT39594.1 MinD/ParA family protein [Pseudothermotoga sp.]
MPNQAEGLYGSHARMVSVASGKGGVGKTVVAVNLSVVLQERGYRVLLFDADAGFANAEILMGVTPRFTLKDFLKKKVDIEEVIFRTPYGVDLISTGMDVEDLITFNVEDKGKVVNELRKIGEDYDYILFDFPPGFNEQLERFYLSSDHVLVLTATEPTALVNAYTFVKILILKGLEPVSFHVVMNMVRDLKEGRKVVEKFGSVVSKFIGVNFDSTHLMKFEPLVRESIARQIPFVVLKKTSQPSLAIHGIADRITNRTVAKRLSFIERVKLLFGMG